MNLKRTLASFLLVAGLLSASISQAVINAYWSSMWGPPQVTGVLVNAGGVTTYAMASLNTGWSARHIAGTVLDVAGVKLVWATVASAGQVSIRIETDDATTGKPTGTLYDANATLTAQVPVAGVQTYTFAVLPTAARTVGLAYHLVVLTTTGGTTQTLDSYLVETNPGSYPSGVLTAADGTTRSNFAEVSNTTPIAVLVMEDGSEVSLEEGLTPFYTSTTNNLVGNAAVGSRIVVPQPISIGGVDIMGFTKTGTPAGDLRVRVLLDGTTSAIAGTTVTVDKDHLLTNASGKGLKIRFPAPVAIAAGTYRAVVDCASCASSNNWRVNSATAIDATVVPSGWQGSTTTDVTANPIVWTDSTTLISPMRFMVTGITAPTGGGGVIGG